MHRMEDSYLCESCFAEMEENESVCPVCGFQKETYEQEAGVLPVGEILAGKYLIGKMLGRGGFGITYLGYDIPGKRKVAIKEYLPDGLASRQPGQTMLSVYTGERENLFQKGAKQFFEEAKMVSRFNGNPNIVSVYEFFYENNTAYFSMEYLDGMDLKQYTVRHGGKLSVKEAGDIILSVMNALIIVHSAGVLHRDISPDNIFLTGDGEVKLIDFGAARQVIGEQSKSLSIVLKQGFAPIEQYQTHGHFGPWSDIYALCAAFYFIITGKVPEAAMDRMDLDQLRPPSEMGVEIPPKLERLLMKGLSYKAADRPQSVIELKAEFLEAMPPEQQEVKKEEPVYVNPYSVQKQEEIKEPEEEVNIIQKKTGDTGSFNFEKNTDYYEMEFAKIEEGKRARFHIPAFFFTSFWMFYRKMFTEGAVLLGGMIVVQMILAGLISSFATSNAQFLFTGIYLSAAIIAGVLCGLFGNLLYYKYVRRTKQQAAFQGESILEKKSGVLKPAVFAGVIVGVMVVNIGVSAASAGILGQSQSNYQSGSGGGGVVQTEAAATTATTQGDLHEAIVQDVRAQKFDNDTGTTLGQVFDLYFSNSRWEAEGTDSASYAVEFTGQAYYANRLTTFKFEFAMSGSEMKCQRIYIGGTSVSTDKWETLLKMINIYYNGLAKKSVDGVLPLMFVKSKIYTTLPEAENLLKKSGLTYTVKTNASGERKDVSVENGRANLRFYKTTRSMSTISSGNYVLIVKNQAADAPSFLYYCMGWSNSATTQFYSSTNSYRLTESSLRGKSQTELTIMRNEVFARHYRKFEDPLLQAVFLTKSWYQARYSESEFTENWNDVEEYNLKLIVKVEKDLGYR